jgi:hypothetical protein
MSKRLGLSAACVLLLASQGVPAGPDSNRFIQVAESDVGGHFFSQVIYAPTAKSLVSWGFCAITSCHQSEQQHERLRNRRHER